MSYSHTSHTGQMCELMPAGGDTVEHSLMVSEIYEGRETETVYLPKSRSLFRPGIKR